MDEREIERAREEARREAAHRCEIAGLEYVVRDLQTRLRAAEDRAMRLEVECEGWRRDDAWRKSYEAARAAEIKERADAVMATFGKGA